MCCSWCLLLCFGFCLSCHAWHVPTCRTPPGEGGGSKCKERGITHLWSAAERAKGCASEARKPGETPCARGAAPMSVLRTCVTKQTKDPRYIGRGTLMVPELGLTHDDAVCPGKRVVSWINVYNFCRATKRKKCLSQSFAASSECRGLRATDGSIATRRVGPKGC